MPPKANMYSAYIYEKMKKHGIRSFQEAQQKYGAAFKTLSEKEKDYYKNLAAIQNGNRVKMTSTGEAVDEILQKQKEHQMVLQTMKDTIQKDIAKYISEGCIKSKAFFIIHMHYHCYRHEMYYPAEVGIAKFSLSKGVLDMYHKIIRPGKLPLGSALDARQHSEETHQIEAPAYGSDNFREVAQEITDFLMKDNDQQPILFCRDEDDGEKTITVVTNIFQNFLRLDTKIWSLDHLFFELSKQLVGAKGFALISLAKHTLEVDQFEYFAEHVCPFHENCDYPYRCSLSIAVRMAYIICNQICGAINIQIIPGRHIPSKINKVIEKGAKTKLENTDEKPKIKRPFDVVNNRYQDIKHKDEEEDGAWGINPLRRPRTAEPSSATSMTSDNNPGCSYDIKHEEEDEDDGWCTQPLRRPRNAGETSSATSRTSDNNPGTSFDSFSNLGNRPLLGRGRGRRFN